MIALNRIACATTRWHCAASPWRGTVISPSQNGDAARAFSPREAVVSGLEPDGGDRFFRPKWQQREGQDSSPPPGVVSRWQRLRELRRNHEALAGQGWRGLAAGIDLEAAARASGPSSSIIGDGTVKRSSHPISAVAALLPWRLTRRPPRRGSGIRFVSWPNKKHKVSNLSKSWLQSVIQPCINSADWNDDPVIRLIAGRVESRNLSPSGPESRLTRHNSRSRGEPKCQKRPTWRHPRNQTSGAAPGGNAAEIALPSPRHRPRRSFLRHSSPECCWTRRSRHNYSAQRLAEWDGAGLRHAPGDRDRMATGHESTFPSPATAIGRSRRKPRRQHSRSPATDASSAISITTYGWRRPVPLLRHRCRGARRVPDRHRRRSQGGLTLTGSDQSPAAGRPDRRCEVRR